MSALAGKWIAMILFSSDLFTGPIFQCNFDRDMCGFTQSTTDQFDWRRRSEEYVATDTGPLADHTTGTEFFLYIEANFRSSGDKAIITKEINFSGVACLNFFYLLRGTNIGTLNVYLGENNKVFSKTGNQNSNGWLKASVTLSGNGKMPIIFEGVVGNGDTEDLAIDDVVILNGACDNPCDFEYGTCEFQQLSNDNFDWTRHSGGTPTSNTGPDGDHTSGKGHYMYIEATQRQSSNFATISKPMPLSENSCLTFYYHMSGSNVGKLRIHIDSKMVFSRKGQQGKDWKKAEIPVRGTRDSTVKFTGYVGKGEEGDIAIDDVSVTHGNCGLDCSFDESFCGFVQSSNDNFNWIRKSGATKTTGTGPARDYPSGDGSYIYIETSSPRKKGHNAIITKRLSFTGVACMRFHYHMKGSSIGRLNIYLGKDNLIFTRSKAQDPKWLMAEITLERKRNEDLIIEGIRSSASTGDIAIDDITIETGQPCACASGAQTTYGECCVFPFTHGGKVYRSCTSVDRIKAWCSVTDNYSVDQEWRFCKGR